MVLVLDNKIVAEGNLDELSAKAMYLMYQGIDKSRSRVTWKEMI